MTPDPFALGGRQDDDAAPPAQPVVFSPELLALIDEVADFILASIPGYDVNLSFLPEHAPQP